MVSVFEIPEIIKKHVQQLPAIMVSLIDSVGCVLAEDVFSPIDSPPFDQSAMDGYAFAYSSLQMCDSLIVAGEIAAGDDGQVAIEKGTAIRIMTGAPIPDTADTVAAFEQCDVKDGELSLPGGFFLKGSNIRFKGSHCATGEKILPAGTMLNAAMVGLLAGLGIAEVLVVAQPRIGLIITGNELTLPGDELSEGQIYDSNSFMLISALKEGRHDLLIIDFCNDDLDEIERSLRKCIVECDLVIITGGVSRGNYDFVSEAFRRCGLQTIFHNVNQKPGKPLLFGKINDCLIWGLPGNPFAVYTCFHKYVVPSIKLLSGSKTEVFASDSARLLYRTEKKRELTVFLKGKITVDGRVIVLDNQESNKLISFNTADCLVVLPEGQTVFHEHEEVSIHYLSRWWQ